MSHRDKDARQQPGAERREHQSAENGHARSMARKAGGVARIVSGVMGDVDVRKPDHPKNEDAQEGGEHRRSESVGWGEGLRPDSLPGADDVRLPDRIRGWGGFEYRLPYSGSPPPEPALPAKYRFHAN